MAHASADPPDPTKTPKHLSEAITNQYDGSSKASTRVERRQRIHRQTEWRQSIRQMTTKATWTMQTRRAKTDAQVGTLRGEQTITTS